MHAARVEFACCLPCRLALSLDHSEVQCAALQGTLCEHLQVGATLLKYIIDVAKVEVPMLDSVGRAVPGRTMMVPAFEQRLQRSWDNRSKAWWKMTGIIVMHNNVFDRLLNAGFEVSVDTSWPLRMQGCMRQGSIARSMARAQQWLQSGSE